MQNEVSEAIELIYLAAGLVKFGGQVILKAPGTVGKIVQGGKTVAETASLKAVQFKLLCQFKNPGKYETLTLKDMDRITGGDYRLLRVPIEMGMENYEVEAGKFFHAMKTLRIPFAEMPDINIGDGYMEIAINPQDAGRLKNFFQEYNWPGGKSAESISLDEYLDHGTREDYAAFQEEAVNNAEKTVQEYVKKNDPGLYRISADRVLFENNRELANLGEKEGTQYIKVPGNYVNGTYLEEYMRFTKPEIQLVNGGQTILASFDPKAEYQLYNPDGSLGRVAKGEELQQKWDATAGKKNRHTRKNGKERTSEEQEERNSMEIPKQYSVKNPSEESGDFPELRELFAENTTKTVYLDRDQIKYMTEKLAFLSLPGLPDHTLLPVESEDLQYDVAQKRFKVYLDVTRNYSVYGADGKAAGKIRGAAAVKSRAVQGLETSAPAESLMRADRIQEAAARPEILKRG